MVSVTPPDTGFCFTYCTTQYSAHLPCSRLGDRLPQPGAVPLFPLRVTHDEEGEPAGYHAGPRISNAQTSSETSCRKDAHTVKTRA